VESQLSNLMHLNLKHFDNYTKKKKTTVLKIDEACSNNQIMSSLQNIDFHYTNTLKWEYNTNAYSIIRICR
jgi:hypothetical protein